LYRVDIYFDEETSPEAWEALPRVLREIVKGWQMGRCFATIFLPDEVVLGGESALHEYLVRMRTKLAEKGYRVKEFGNVEKIWDVSTEPSEESVC